MQMMYDLCPFAPLCPPAAASAAWAYTRTAPRLATRPGLREAMQPAAAGRPADTVAAVNGRTQAPAVRIMATERMRIGTAEGACGAD